LNPNGLLFIGESECFSFPENTFELLDTKGSYAYRKPGSK
jgi:chemotaxis methyl-accepting protein methylase